MPGGGAVWMNIKNARSAEAASIPILTMLLAFGLISGISFALDGTGSANYICMWNDTDTIQNSPISYVTTNATSSAGEVYIKSGGQVTLWLNGTSAGVPYTNQRAASLFRFKDEATGDYYVNTFRRRNASGVSYWTENVQSYYDNSTSTFYEPIYAGFNESGSNASQFSLVRSGFKYFDIGATAYRPIIKIWGTVTINGTLSMLNNVSINGTVAIRASDNSSMLMCLNVSQTGLVWAYECGTVGTPPVYGGEENHMGEYLILAGVALIYIAFGVRNNGTN
jgi:hypothetical protein